MINDILIASMTILLFIGVSILYCTIAGIASAYFEYFGEKYNCNFFGVIWPISISIVICILILGTPFICYYYMKDKISDYLNI